MKPQFLSGFTAVALAFACAAPPLRGEHWSAWSEKTPGTPFVVRFEPYADTHWRKFSSSDVKNHSDMIKRLEFPGEVVFEAAESAEAKTASAIAPGTPLRFTVEIVDVDIANSGAPKINKSENFAANPQFPFGLPTGRAAAPYETSEVLAAAPAPGSSVRVVAHVPDIWRAGSWKSMVTRLRWRVTSADGRREFARGVIPTAIEQSEMRYGHDRNGIVIETGIASKIDWGDRNYQSTPLTPEAWPMMIADVDCMLFDTVGFGKFFGGDKAAASKFVTRARLAGVELLAHGTETKEAVRAAGATSEPEILVPIRSCKNDFGGNNGTKINNSAINANLSSKYAAHGKKLEEEIASNDRKLEPARIPVATLGRDQKSFVTASYAFLLAFALGAVAVLVRHFAFSRGEARIAMWRALPVWSVACALFGFIALPRLLDRRPYADVTEWRYGIDGIGEALCIADGRFQSFSSRPSSWKVPADAFFRAKFSNMNRSSWTVKNGMKTVRDDTAGVITTRLPDRTPGETEHVTAMRFAPHDPAVSISPDPDFDFEECLRETLANFKLATVESDPDAHQRLAKLLGRWTTAGNTPPWNDDTPAPSRTVTAHGNFSGVYAFAGGSWYALGAMTNGEERVLDKSLRVTGGMTVTGKTYNSLFENAPFNIMSDELVRFANAWLARDKKNGSSAASHATVHAEPEECDNEDGFTNDIVETNHAQSNKDSAAEFSTNDIRNFVGQIDAAFVFAIEDAGSGGATFLSPEVPAGDAARVTARIVHVEVFP